MKEITTTEKLFLACANVHALLACATRHGGLWVSASGGTANVLAGEIARGTGASYEDAHRVMDLLMGEDWYTELYHNQPQIDWDDLRWDARTIARAACRMV